MIDLRLSTQNAALTDLGVDSLMAVELKNHIEGDLRMNIPVTYFLEEATVIDLSKKIHHQLGDGAQAENKEYPDEPVDSDTARTLLANMEQLSDDQVDSLLHNLLANPEDS